MQSNIVGATIIYTETTIFTSESIFSPYILFHGGKTGCT